MLLFLILISDESRHSKILWLYDTYHDNMLRYARRLLSLYGNKKYMRDSEDVIQNAFFKITKSIDRIDTTLPEKVIGGYLMTVVKHEVTEFMKTERSDLSLDDMLTVCEDCNYLKEFAKKELYNKVVREINRMEPIYRDVMIMKFIDEKNTKEIAETLDVPEKTVYTRISRAIGILRENFKDEVL